MSENIRKKIQRLAKTQKLGRVNFLDANGKVGARGNLVHGVELQFDNGEFAACDVETFMTLQHVKFTLMDEAEWQTSQIEAESTGRLQ